MTVLVDLFIVTLGMFILGAVVFSPIWVLWLVHWVKNTYRNRKLTKTQQENILLYHKFVVNILKYYGSYHISRDNTLRDIFIDTNRAIKVYEDKPILNTKNGLYIIKDNDFTFNTDTYAPDVINFEGEIMCGNFKDYPKYTMYADTVKYMYNNNLMDLFPDINSIISRIKKEIQDDTRQRLRNMEYSTQNLNEKIYQEEFKKHNLSWLIEKYPEYSI